MIVIFTDDDVCRDSVVRVSWNSWIDCLNSLETMFVSIEDDDIRPSVVSSSTYCRAICLGSNDTISILIAEAVY